MPKLIYQCLKRTVKRVVDRGSIKVSAESKAKCPKSPSKKNFHEKSTKWQSAAKVLRRPRVYARYFRYFPYERFGVSEPVAILDFYGLRELNKLRKS